MIVTENLMIETEIPLKQVTKFHFIWTLNAHADLKLEGILDSQLAEAFLFQNYKNTKLKVVYENEMAFHGIVQETLIHVVGSVYHVSVRAVSATWNLDKDKCSEMFQDTSYTYKKMLQQMVMNASGNVICTIGDEVIKKPLLCYEETVWQYAIRMASHFYSHVMADVKTGKPEFWFGLRKGKRIEEHNLACEQIEVKKYNQQYRKDKISYLLSGRENYQLGDQLWSEDGWKIIYEKRGLMERGELLFSYMVAEESTLTSEVKYQNKIIGLSLKGTVERAEEEQIYIKLSMDGKSGTYPFLWYPETGNTLYAMPEPGAEAEVHFVGNDEREAIAVRCRDTTECDCGEKRLEIPGGIKMSMNASTVRMEKKDRMVLTDRSIDISGNHSIDISAAGKVKIVGRIIEVVAEDEIKYVTEG